MMYNIVLLPNIYSFREAEEGEKQKLYLRDESLVHFLFLFGPRPPRIPNSSFLEWSLKIPYQRIFECLINPFANIYIFTGG